MMFDNCNECPNYNSNSCPFAGSSEGHKRRVCQLLRLGTKPYNDTPTEPKDCLKCPRRGTGKCAFLNRSYNEKCRCLWVLSEGYNAYDADMLAESLQVRLNAIKGIEPDQQEMDYNRNDAKQIVNSMRPNNN